jgi:hypothetical protein
MKDIILTRLKAYNLLALLDFVVVVLERYYCGRLLNAAFGRLTKPYLLYDKLRDTAEVLIKSCPDAVSHITASQYTVVSSQLDGIVYEVDTDSGVCSCYSGIQGGFCKNQAAVHLVFGIAFPNSPLLTSSDKSLLYQVATGQDAAELPVNFLEPMTATGYVERSISHIPETTPTHDGDRPTASRDSTDACAATELIHRLQYHQLLSLRVCAVSYGRTLKELFRSFNQMPVMRVC